MGTKNSGLRWKHTQCTLVLETNPLHYSMGKLRALRTHECHIEKGTNKINIVSHGSASKIVVTRKTCKRNNVIKGWNKRNNVLEHQGLLHTTKHTQ